MHALRSRTRYTTICRYHRQLSGHKNYATSPLSSLHQGQSYNRQEEQTGQRPTRKDTQHGEPATAAAKEPGAMARRLEQMTDEALESSGARADKIVAETGFSEELKKKLEGKILDAGIKSENAHAFAEVSMPASAGQGTRDVALAQPWSGEEMLSDTTLRMLTDAYKPMRIPSGGGAKMSTNPIDLRPKIRSVDKGMRLASARDKTSIYSQSQDNTMSAGEREAMRRQLQERFQPGARSIPATVQGIQSIASQRIEDAIARGLFKNIPRGKGVNVERDHNADSPFIDTTEYFMNKIVKKQDLTPPWIEKQAEIHSFAARFRGRLRADWKRHAARVIASRGGSMEEQIMRAKAYASAEAIDNPNKAKKDVEGSTETPDSKTSPIVEEKTISLDSKTVIMESSTSTDDNTVSLPENLSIPLETELKLPPFRDPAWNSIEASYHTMAINQLNSLTRSYNLMAPELAKKPYYSLERELRACYAEVAPQLADEIRNRALAPKLKVDIINHTPGGVMQRFSGGESAKVVADRRKPYGFKEFWRDLFPAKEGV